MKGRHHTPEHVEKIAATKRGKPRSAETRAKISAAHMGKMTGAQHPNFRPLDDRFWEKVRKTDTCWLWSATHDTHGYGMVSASIRGPRRQHRAHRVAWELTRGPIPDGMWVLHRCDNPPCVNPGHLFLGTNADNMHDMWTKARRPRAMP